MPSVQYLREFINERLTAAAEQIFLEFEKTIVQYEEEIDRQRRLLDITWKPQIKLHRTDVPQQHVLKKEKVPTKQQVCNQENNSSLEQGESESPQVKEEPEGEQLVLKEETDTFMVTTTCDKSDQNETDGQRLLFLSSAVAENQDQRRSEKLDSESIRFTNKSPKNEKDSTASGSRCNSDKSKKYLKCDVCGKVFRYNCEMTRHYRIHTGEKPFSCTICGKGFVCTGSLGKHRRAHTGEKPYPCTTCGKMFAYNSDLLKHLKTHTGEKPYHCKTCGKSFSRDSMLTEHIRTHTGEKPYGCKTCGKMFNSRTHLLRHMKTHAKRRTIDTRLLAQ
uniref:zinc finger protein 485-like n=1 Tax=Maylandia zebra TaxID=106582 RepID=UPI000C234FBC|nr:zinc finger protein 485-like [Maylandia zebra]